MTVNADVDRMEFRYMCGIFHVLNSRLFTIYGALEMKKPSFLHLPVTDLTCWCSVSWLWSVSYSISSRFLPRIVLVCAHLRFSQFVS